MEPVHSLQRLDQKRLDEVKRMRSALETEESPLTEAEKDTIADNKKGKLISTEKLES
jgi:hypothetical protein